MINLLGRLGQRTARQPCLAATQIAWSQKPAWFSTSEFNVKRLKKKQARQWMDRHINDEFVKKAKIQAYRSRAAFKLMEIDDKHKLLKKGTKVIDVGAAPGGWSQVVAERTQSRGGGQETVVAVDLLEMIDVGGVKFIQGDIESEEV